MGVTLRFCIDSTACVSCFCLHSLLFNLRFLQVFQGRKFADTYKRVEHPDLEVCNSRH